MYGPIAASRPTRREGRNIVTIDTIDTIVISQRLSGVDLDPSDRHHIDTVIDTIRPLIDTIRPLIDTIDSINRVVFIVAFALRWRRWR